MQKLTIVVIILALYNTKKTTPDGSWPECKIENYKYSNVNMRENIFETGLGKRLFFRWNTKAVIYNRKMDK